MMLVLIKGIFFSFSTLLLSKIIQKDNLGDINKINVILLKVDRLLPQGPRELQNRVKAESFYGIKNKKTHTHKEP